MNGSTTVPIEFPRPEPWPILAYGALVIVEVCWIAPWFQLFPQEGALSEWVILSVFATILLTSLLVFRLVVDLAIRKDLRPWVTAGLVVLSLLFAIKVLVYPGQTLSPAGLINHIMEAMNSDASSFPLEFYVALFVFLSVYRGSALARAGIDPSAVLDHLRLGCVMLFVGGILSALTSRVPSGLFGYLAVFLFAGLIALTTGRLAILGQTRGGRSVSFDRRRLFAVLASTLVLVVFALGLAIFISSPAGIHFFLGVAALMQALLAGILGLIGLLLTPLLILIVFMIRTIGAGIHQAPLPDLNQNLNNTLQEWQKLFEQQATTLNPILRPIFLWGILLIVFVVVLLVARARLSRKQAVGFQEVDSLLSGEDLLKQIWKDLRQLPVRLAHLGNIRRAQRRAYAARIRKIYADLLELAAGLKVARLASQTPLEYLPALQSAFPDFRVELERITQAYLGVRYGDYPETPEQVAEVEAAWERLRESVNHRREQ